MKPKNTFIYLIGFPGSGKLTIAKELQKIIPSILVDNHLINNVVFSLIDTDGKTKLPMQVWDHTLAVRKIALATIRDLAKPDRNFIFTNCLREGDAVDRELYEEIVALAQFRSAKLLPVRISISIDELRRRVVSPGRKALLKDINPLGADENSLNSTVLRPDGCFELNVTELTAVAAAQRIVEELELRHGA